MKKLMNEVLPAPMQQQESAVRRRVMKHMRDAVAAGATAGLLAGCPFVVVDPMPPPAKCKDLGSVKDTLRVTLLDQGNDTVQVTVALVADSGVTFGLNALVNGGTVQGQRVNTEGAEFTVQAPSNSFTIDLPTTCTSGYGSSVVESSVRITVTRSGGMWNYTLEDRAALDGGFPRDGGP